MTVPRPATARPRRRAAPIAALAAAFLLLPAVAATAHPARARQPAVTGQDATDRPITERTITDGGITNAVENELVFEPVVRLNDIDVATKDGVVTLSGTVTTLLARERAADLAATVKGVRAVVNDIAVEPADERSDEEIAADVDGALALDPATDSYEVDVAVDRGIVTLTGAVQSWQERRLSERVAKGVRGVRAVSNRLVVDAPGEPREDDEIRADIEQALRWDSLLEQPLIAVHVDDGAVELTGTLGSLAEKRRAEAAALVWGVTAVDTSGLTVHDWARDRFQRSALVIDRPDDAIAAAVQDALALDPRVSAFSVRATVKDGVVTLRGVVDNLKAKRAAEHDARRTTGVTWVHNRLRVRTERPVTPETIEQAVEATLARDPYLADADLVVRADRAGTVYLEGTVDTYAHKAIADDLAARVEGVAGVRNRLAVRDPGAPLPYHPYVHETPVVVHGWYHHATPTAPLKPDVQIARDVIDELFWSPFVDADEIEVTVQGGVVTLEGTVDSWMERSAARDNAFEGGGLRVIDRMEVRDR